jgi:hypothetical protein
MNAAGGLRSRPTHVCAGLALVALVAACTTPAARSSEIVCSTAYRVSTNEALTDVDTIRLADEDSTGSIPYIYLEFHAEYGAGFTDAERALRVWVTPTGDDRALVSHLFELSPDSGPINQFSGGHGFTGLNYAYDPVSGAELQYWCETG